jgi:sugar transferase (PEP-CTERM/EpsH1 system associated)
MDVVEATRTVDTNGQTPEQGTGLRGPVARLRVLHVVPVLGLGGTEQGLLKVIRGLGSEEFEHAICAVRGVDEAFVKQSGLQIPIFSAGTTKPGFQFPLLRLARIMRTYRPHVAHSRNFGALEAVMAAKLARVPVAIHSEHGYELEILQGLPLRRRLLCCASYNAADSVFTVTDELRAYHSGQSWVSPKKFRVIYNGVNTDRFSTRPEMAGELRTELAIPAGRFVVGSVGRLVPIKSHKTLLEAAQIAIGNGIDLHVVLVGSGRELERLQSQVQLSDWLRGRVTFVGASNRIPELLNAMDAFVLPSVREGMSNTVLEAMATALPVLLTNTGGNPELVTDGVQGKFFSPGDAASLAELIGYLAQDADSRKKLGKAARQEVESRFSLAEMIRQYRELYFTLATNGEVSGRK